MSAATIVAEHDDALDYAFYMDGCGEIMDAYILGPKAVLA